ncbi:glutathione peroxidase [Crocinitomicaceae bacterium]|jgi:glutathione peroxidase|nr:glutathione peroxidase [Crocinitomicaceae bacterium]
MSESKLYSFKANTLKGETVSLDQFKGKTLMIVNTASKCGLTPQYEGLEKLYQNYKDKDFLVLGFPCNQFGHQEPGSADEIESFCEVNYGVSFPMFEKVDVNGKDAHPLFKYLKRELGGFLGSKIKWNFTKFVIDQNGNPIKRYAPTTKPESIEGDIRKLVEK